MEKSSNMKQHSICNSTRNMKQLHDFKVRCSSFDYSSSFGDGDFMAAGFSWPPRSYICSFCKRDFTSAQALGGHMNVHRRDRARLRQSPVRDNGGQFSLLNLNLEPCPSLCPNPSFYPSSSPPVTKFPPFTSKIPPPSEISKCGGDRRPITKDLMKLKEAKGLRGVERFESSSVSLELGMGLISPSKEKLDLELRLGYN